MNNKSDDSQHDEILKSLLFEKDISDQIINHSRSMISIINHDYVYERVNAAFCFAHQVESESMVGKTLEDMWGYDTFINHIKKNADLGLSGKTITYEAAFVTPRHGKRYYEVAYRPLYAGGDKVTHLLVETFDINDLRLSRQEAFEKQEELKKFETNLPIGFLRCDPDGTILDANNAFMRIMEYTGDVSLPGRNIKDFYNAPVYFDTQIDELIRYHSKTFGRVYLINSKGNEIPCRISGFLAVDASGAPSFIDFAVEDLSRELMLENRLLQAQKLETIGALAGGIAHDFNNILATISGYSEMLQEDLPRDSGLSEKVGRIQNAVLKAQSITNQILTFSRHVEQEKVPISVSEILKETIGFVKSTMPATIALKERIPLKNPEVLADPTQLFRVFLNLMTNAIQSMEQDGGTLSVKMTIVKGIDIRTELNKDIVADEYVLISFKDTGKGMEPSLMARIFEPFFTTREVGQGTGLGLSVIHGIITELEGEILVSSKVEKGSVFYLYLPVSKKYPDSYANSDKKKKLLFITGNKYESRVLSIALQSSGYSLLYVSDSLSLTAVMNDAARGPDLIIYMGDTTQIQPDELISIFERQKIFPPCILITDNNLNLIEEKLLNSGIIKQHLVKPVSLKEIRSAIHASLRQT